jgi:hypothetical protein
MNYSRTIRLILTKTEKSLMGKGNVLFKRDNTSQNAKIELGEAGIVRGEATSISTCGYLEMTVNFQVYRILN